MNPPMNKTFKAAHRAMAASLALLAASLLAGCGGSELVSTFTPARIVALGDESSVIEDVNGDANGRKYSVNATQSATDSTLACRSNPLWIQVVANNYGLSFPQCNPAPAAAAAPTSRIRALPGAKVADLEAQIDAQQAESPLGAGDLVMIMVGDNDILAQYQQYPGVAEADLTRNLQVAGVTLAAQVNRISDTGAKVIIATAYDLGVTPFGQAEKASHTDTDRADLLSRLTIAFNSAMRGGDQALGKPGNYNDGRKIGLVLADDFFRLAAANPGSYGYTDVTTPVCAVALPNCTTLTLIPSGNGIAFLWADTTRLSAGGQTALGNLALTRATNNPF
jgi:phospholipase/lecithinase/hemolysin